MKTILFSFLMIVLSAGAYAGVSNTEMEARQELTRKVQKILSDEMNQYKNFFYEHDISSIREKVEVTCAVNEDNNVQLVRVKCTNCDASEFVKYVLAQNRLKVDKILAGKVYRFNVELRYKAW